MREAQFTFTPLRKASRIVKKMESDPMLRIGKTGTIIFTPAIMAHVGIDPSKGSWIKIYADVTKRAFGFQIKQEVSVGNKDSSIRRLNIMKAKDSEYRFCQISIASFLKQIGGIKYSHKLKIKSHTDPVFGKIFYVEIPQPLFIPK